jgi:hypothetical protein
VLVVALVSIIVTARRIRRDTGAGRGQRDRANTQPTWALEATNQPQQLLEEPELQRCTPA